jgi:hypothetical protein
MIMDGSAPGTSNAGPPPSYVRLPFFLEPEGADFPLLALPAEGSNRPAGNGRNVVTEAIETRNDMDVNLFVIDNMRVPKNNVSGFMHR